MNGPGGLETPGKQPRADQRHQRHRNLSNDKQTAQAVRVRAGHTTPPSFFQGFAQTRPE